MQMFFFLDGGWGRGEEVFSCFVCSNLKRVECVKMHNATDSTNLSLLFRHEMNRWNVVGVAFLC